MKLIVTFYTLSGKFDRVKKEEFASRQEAFIAVKAYGEAGGFTNIKAVEGDGPDDDGLRYTGKTPGGRSGRNIAMADYEY